jgi:predicted TIM-barrel fold metal-dependent hydrolase
MPMPTDVPIIDLMLAVPNDDTSNFYDFIRPLLMDEQSRQMFQMPAQYMFKDLPKVGKRDDYIAYTLEKMDEFNIEKAMLGVDEGQYETQCEAVKKHPDRFFASYDCNPNNGMDEVRKIRRLKEEYDIKSVNAFPSGLCPQVSLSDKKWYPIFVTCIDLDIPFCPLRWRTRTPNSHGTTESRAP